MLQYITLDTYWEELAVGDSVTFHIPHGFSYKYFITHTKLSDYYCYINGMSNRKIFEILRIEAEKFVTSIVNYISIGDWPEVKTIDDLKKVIKALDNECIKKWGMPNQNVSPYNLKNGDYIKIISTKFDIPFICLFKEMQSNRIWRHASYDLKYRTSDVYPRYWLFNDNTKITYATEEERKLLDNVLLEQGLKWNNLTKQLDNIGVVDTSINNLKVQPIDISPLYPSYVNNSIQRINDLLTDLPSFTKTETQIETELNLFPKKKHYQLNFNY